MTGCGFWVDLMTLLGGGTVVVLLIWGVTVFVNFVSDVRWVVKEVSPDTDRRWCVSKIEQLRREFASHKEYYKHEPRTDYYNYKPAAPVEVKSSERKPKAKKP